MNKLLAIVSLIAFVGCTSAQQAKVNTVVDLVECKAEVLKPYVDYLRSEDFTAAVAGEDYFQILIDAGITPSEVQKLVADMKACHEETK